MNPKLQPPMIVATDGVMSLTKREMFAAMAMQGILANSSPHTDVMSLFRDRAVLAAMAADALIDELDGTADTLRELEATS